MPERDDLNEKNLEDLVDGPAPAGHGWAVAAGRGLGAAARAVADGVDALAALLNPCTWTSRAPAEEGPKLDAVLRELGETVAQHADAGYAPLAEDERFWRLLEQLRGLGPPGGGRRELPPATAEPGEGAETAPPEQAEPAEEPDSGRVSDADLFGEAFDTSSEEPAEGVEGAAFAEGMPEAEGVSPSEEEEGEEEEEERSEKGAPTKRGKGKTDK